MAEVHPINVGDDRHRENLARNCRMCRRDTVRNRQPESCRRTLRRWRRPGTTAKPGLRPPVPRLAHAFERPIAERRRTLAAARYGHQHQQVVRFSVRRQRRNSIAALRQRKRPGGANSAGDSGVVSVTASDAQAPSASAALSSKRTAKAALGVIMFIPNDVLSVRAAVRRQKVGANVGTVHLSGTNHKKSYLIVGRVPHILQLRAFSEEHWLYANRA